MNIQVIAEHSVDVDLLPEGANILDAGCRGFEFSKELTRIGHTVITIDADSRVLGEHICAYTAYPQMIGRHFHAALTNSEHCAVPFLMDQSDPQASRVAFGEATGTWIKSETIESISRKCNIDFWGLIKLDIEGSEREVIMSIDRTYATQISVEFHLHTGIYDMRAVDEMVSKLKSLGYDPIRHEMTSRHGMGMNYWDSLFVLKNG